MPLVTLLTDFGLEDPYVGELKGALSSVVSGIELIDITHGVSPGNVREGAWILGKSFEFFPEESCHLAVVDPGVGGGRRGLVARAGGHFFVGPDNGLLACALDAAGGAGEIREITLREIDRPRRGTTFDGRDLFAPVAARVASGMPIREAGPEVHDPILLEPFRPLPKGEQWDVEVVRADRFGNLVTVAGESFLRESFGEDWRGIVVQAGDHEIEGVRVAYEEVATGQPLLSIGSCGTLEVSVNRGSAAESLGVRPGDSVRVSPPRSV